MKVNSPRFLLLALSASGLLLWALVFLYGKTQHFNEANYLKDVGTLRQLKQLDAQWDRDVLKSRISHNRNYDTLAKFSGEMDSIVRALEVDLGRAHHELAKLEKARAALLKAVGQKAELVERFQSKNAVLRKSLEFLPTSATGVLQAIDLRMSGPRSFAEHEAAVQVNSLLLSTLLYNQQVSDQGAAEVESGLAALHKVRRLLPQGTQERLDIFSAHVRITAGDLKNVSDLVIDIGRTPTSESIDEVYEVLTREQEASAKESRTYRQYLLLFSTALVALLLYAAARLLRQAETDRANRELHSVNEQLEHRVLERTLELQNTQGELVATARRAGRAEIATNVLHNVGNILNSVNVSAGMIVDTLRRSRAHGLARAIRMMDDHAGDLAHFLTADEKGRLLPGYLSGAAATVAQEQQAMLDELGHLTKSIDHIKDVVSTQQLYAGGSSVVEPASIEDLAEDALRMNADTLAQRNVTVVKEFMEVPQVRVDRARVLQILVNLISNANNAMEDGGERPRRIVLRVAAQNERLRVSVQDDGVGISAENLTRIFSHGFTTRAAGHGFGLHSCALAARQMGGTLMVHSDGPGHGATFTLELPLDAVPVAA